MPKTLVLRVDPENPDPAAIERAADIIKSGGIVAFPTETVYGLGGDAFNDAAVKKIFAAKGRPPDNPLIVHVSGIAMLGLVAAEVSPPALALAERFWPGPLTLVLERGDRIPASVSALLPTVAVRMPANKIALELILAAGTPIAAPSANVSTRPSATSASHVLEDLDGKIDLVLDGGRTQIGIESTVLDLTADPPVVLRPGWVTPESIEEVVGEVRVAASPEELSASPGTRHRHYTPSATVVLIESHAISQLRNVLQEYLHAGPVAFIGHSPVDLKAPDLTKVALSDAPRDYAASIYSAMRDVDSRGIPVVVVEGIAGGGEALAVMDRLRRAASRIVS